MNLYDILFFIGLMFITIILAYYLYIVLLIQEKGYPYCVKNCNIYLYKNKEMK